MIASNVKANNNNNKRFLSSKYINQEKLDD